MICVLYFLVNKMFNDDDFCMCVGFKMLKVLICMFFNVFFVCVINQVLWHVIIVKIN